MYKHTSISNLYVYQKNMNDKQICSWEYLPLVSIRDRLVDKVDSTCKNFISVKKSLLQYNLYLFSGNDKVEAMFE